MLEVLAPAITAVASGVVLGSSLAVLSWLGLFIRRGGDFDDD